VLHSIAYAPAADLRGRVVDSSAAGFARAMDISCHSFLRMARLAEPLMHERGCLLTMSYRGADDVVSNYGLMGPVKAALESSVRYLAAELGPRGIRVNAISPGPLATRAASGIAGFDALLASAAPRSGTPSPSPTLAPCVLSWPAMADAPSRAARCMSMPATTSWTEDAMHNRYARTVPPPDDDLNLVRNRVFDDIAVGDRETLVRTLATADVQLFAVLSGGASLCAMRGLASVATTMGFSALDGLMVGTRCGALDPGALLYLMEAEGMSTHEAGQLLYHQSGLLGVSGISPDPRVLLEREADNAHARDALALYVRRIVREIGALAAVLGGLDMLVFTAGIGEHNAEIRRRVCAGLAFLGVGIADEANLSHAAVISQGRSVLVAVEPVNEEWIAARHAARLLREAATAGAPDIEEDV
jgi:hypothetical protein